MNFLRQSRCLSLIAALLLPAAGLFAGKDALVVSVRGQVAPDYRRVKLPNGKYEAERYVVSNGGKFPGTGRNASMEKIDYPEVAGVVARHLAAQQYYLAQKAKDADLLIAIYWGTTIPFNNASYGLAVDQVAGAVAAQGPMPTVADRIMNGASTPAADSLNTGNLEFAMARVEMENRQRDIANLDNAKVLGYLDEINDRRTVPTWADVGDVARELQSDVEEERYYIVVRAYDFKALQRDGKQVVRWITHISIGAQGNGFDERLAQMVAAAAGAFGEKQGLKRRYYGDPRVELGEVEFLGVAAPAKPAPETDKETDVKKGN